MRPTFKIATVLKICCGGHVCQSASNWDPVSARKRDPVLRSQTSSARPSGAHNRVAGRARVICQAASGAVLEAPAFVPRLDDLAVMREAIK